jgi:hypothetical protein
MPVHYAGREGAALEMLSRTKLILLCLTGLFAVGLVGAPLASAEEPEAPFWKVAKARLGPEQTREVKLKLKPETTSTLYTTIAGVKVKEVCSVAFSEEMLWKGSESHEDGKIVTRIRFENCVLYAENSKKEWEPQTGCADEPMTIFVEGKLWFEGSKEEKKETIVALLKPKLAEKIIGTQKINKLEGKPCIFAGTYNIEGSVAALVTPENVEAKTGTVIFPKTSIGEVWQPQDGGVAAKPEAFIKESKVTFEAEFITELTSGKEFGAFS